VARGLKEVGYRDTFQSLYSLENRKNIQIEHQIHFLDSTIGGWAVERWDRRESAETWIDKHNGRRDGVGVGAHRVVSELVSLF